MTCFYNYIDHNPYETEYIIQQAKDLAGELKKTPGLLKKFITKAMLSDKDITLTVSQSALHRALELAPPLKDTTIELTEKVRLKRCQGEKKLCLENGTSEKGENINPALIKAISRAHVWNQMLVTGKVQSIKEIEDLEQMSSRYVRRVLPLAFLPRQLIEDILAGKQDPHMSIDSIS